MYSRFKCSIFCHRQSGDINLLDQVIFKLDQNISISGMFNPPLSNGKVMSHLFILSGLQFHRKLNDIVLSSCRIFGSISGQTIATWLNLDNAIDFIIVILPRGVRCL